VIICWNCGHENNQHTKECERCGVVLGTQHQSTREFNDTDYGQGIPKWGPARFNGELMDLVIETLNTHETFTFEAEHIDELTIGRKDPDTGEAPPVDLSNAEGEEKGVSRLHATVVQRGGALHIVDNRSANGTFLNGQRLVAHQPRILRDGDDIRLGHLTVRITFRIREGG
jgi:hypothetical protein